MITRHRVSLIFPIPAPLPERDCQGAGGHGRVVGQLVRRRLRGAERFQELLAPVPVDPDTYFDLYPEFQLPPDQLAAFKKERNACVIGPKLAQQHGFKLGDVITMEGIFIPEPASGWCAGSTPVGTRRRMRPRCLPVRLPLRAGAPARAGTSVDAGFLRPARRVVRRDGPGRAAVDTQFVNSRSPTKTESEREFQQSFVQMSSAIHHVAAGDLGRDRRDHPSGPRQHIIMSVRERTREYAVLKTLGFSGRHLAGFVLGESARDLALGRGARAAAHVPDREKGSQRRSDLLPGGSTSRPSPWRSGSGRPFLPGSPPRPSLQTASCACRSCRPADGGIGCHDADPVPYIWRSLWARRLTTALTVGGVALVVFVFAGVLMLARGLEATLIETGSPANVIVLRRSATSELSSQVDRATADVLEARVAWRGGPKVARSCRAKLILVIDLYKKKSNALGNVSIRGVSPRALELRPGVHIVQGRPSSSARTKWWWGRASRRSSRVWPSGPSSPSVAIRWTVVGIR